MRLKQNLAADAALVLTTIIWGSTFVIAKDVLDYWPPIAYITLRFALAAVVLAAIFAKQLTQARLPEWRAGATLGVLIGTGFALQAVGQVYTTPAKSAFITGLTTPLVPFVAFALLKVRPNLENLLGVTLASIGGALILAPTGAGGVNTGDLLTLCCTILFAAHIALMSVYARRIDTRQLTVLQITTAAVVFIIIWFIFKACAALGSHDSLPEIVARESAPLVWSGRVVGQIIYLAVVATVATFLLWTWGQARMSATHAAVIFSLEPVFATVFAVAVRGRGQWTGGRASVGAMLILAGVIISELRLTRNHDEETTGEI